MYNVRNKRSVCHWPTWGFRTICTLKFEPYGAPPVEVVAKFQGGQAYLASTMPRQANYACISMDDSQRLVHSESNGGSSQQCLLFTLAIGFKYLGLTVDPVNHLSHANYSFPGFGMGIGVPCFAFGYRDDEL